VEQEGWTNRAARFILPNVSRIASNLPVFTAQFREKGKKRKGGRKTLAWEAARALLKIRFRRAGIESCEATFPHDCWQTSGLSFAHSKRRNDIVGDEIYEVALLCPDAHRIADDRPKAETTELIRSIIAKRGKQP
jgi:hypothetical protein